MTDLALSPSPRLRGFARPKLAAHLFTLLFLAAWQAASLVAPPYLLPSPVQVALRLWQFVTSARDLGHLGASLSHVAVAIAVSFAIGTLLALIAYYLPALRLAVERRIGPFLNSFSAIGWTLLSIMWFGVTPLTVVFASARISMAKTCSKAGLKSQAWPAPAGSTVCSWTLRQETGSVRTAAGPSRSDR
jgi:ABC-type nitrate/sulfonate/bicarbonate transport system permease component